MTNPIEMDETDGGFLKNGGTPSHHVKNCQMVSWLGWCGGTTILGNLQISSNLVKWGWVKTNSWGFIHEAIGIKHLLRISENRALVDFGIGLKGYKGGTNGIFMGYEWGMLWYIL